MQVRASVTRTAAVIAMVAAMCTSLTAAPASTATSTAPVYPTCRSSSVLSSGPPALVAQSSTLVGSRISSRRAAATGRVARVTVTGRFSWTHLVTIRATVTYRFCQAGTGFDVTTTGTATATSRTTAVKTATGPADGTAWAAASALARRDPAARDLRAARSEAMKVIIQQARSAAITPSGTPGLRGRVGVYSLVTPANLASVGSVGATLVLGGWSPGVAPPPGVRIVDGWAESAMYDMVCHRTITDESGVVSTTYGMDTCAADNITPEALQQLGDSVYAHALAAWGSGNVAGFYLLDDPWTPLFAKVLPYVRAAIRRAAPAAPTACGFYLPLTYQVPAGTPDGWYGTLAYASRVFKTALRNYSPSWCDAPMIYAYAPDSSAPATRVVNWSMSDVLPMAIAQLKAARQPGLPDVWDPATQPLIGIPQAFGQHGILQSGVTSSTTYLPTPDAGQLQSQIAAFCAGGAQSIVGYTWDDGALNSDELSGSQVADLLSGLTSLVTTVVTSGLKTGFIGGVGTCRTRYW